MLKIGFNPQAKTTQQNNRMNFKAEKEFYLEYDKQKKDLDRTEALNYAHKLAKDKFCGDKNKDVWYYEVWWYGINHTAYVVDGEDCDENKIMERLRSAGRHQPQVTTVLKIQPKFLDGANYKPY